MILLFTDFGAEGPYLGQVIAAIKHRAPQLEVVNLLSNAPRNPRLAAYLLAALAPQIPGESTFFCVVDPGVGSERLALALEADGRWFVGPDNGLLEVVARRAQAARWLSIDWRPQALSASFHGRDLFAPIAARIASQDFSWEQQDLDGPDCKLESADLDAVIYCDHYGNAITGRRYSEDLAGLTLQIREYRLPQARTFSEVAFGIGFWYRNSMDLVEIAINGGRADTVLGLSPGQPLQFAPGLSPA